MFTIRGRGYAVDVTVSIVRLLRQQDKPAFVHIEPESRKSLGLARKLGFVEMGHVMWVGF
jgi:L-amino acid N-acyltransferase YncA